MSEPLVFDVTEVGSAVPPGSVVRNVGLEPLHLGPSCGDPQLLAGQSGVAREGLLITATGQRSRAEVSPPPPPSQGEEPAARPARRVRQAAHRARQTAVGRERGRGARGKAAKPAPRKAKGKPPGGTSRGRRRG